MKKYLKKTMSITLAGMMLASTVPAVNAASADTSFAQPCVVDYFNSFNGYVKTAGNNIKEPTPEGFNAHNLDGLNYRHQYLASGTSTDGANTYLKFTNNGNTHSGMQMKMGETINSGKLHISFDLKIDALDTFKGFDLRAINAAKNNNVDDWVQADGKTKDTNNVLKLGGNKKIILGTTDKESTTSTVDTYSTSWNKYDLIIDLDTNKMNFYINGTLKDENVTYDQDIKALMFFTSTDENGATTTNMDNLFIKHYPNGELGAPEMVVDYAGTAVPSSSATVYVGFSELTGKSVAKVEKTDFAAVNVVTGEKITPNGAAREAGMVKLTFNTLPAGKYEIKVQDSAAGLYTGEISGKAATVSNTFSVAGAAQNVKEENVLVSDDFENYNGGMPANAVGLNLDKTHDGGTLEKVAGKNGSGSGLKITSTKIDDMERGLAIYKLPYAVTSGKLTYEFDINHTNGMWFTGVLGAECFETDTYSKEVYDQIIAGTATDNAKAIDKVRLRYKTFAVGCKSTNKNTETNSVTAALDKGFGFNGEISTNSYTSLVDGLTLEPGAWNHVKVEIDIDNAIQTITVGEGDSATTRAFKVYEARFRPGSVKREATLEQQYRYKQREVAGETKWVKTMTAGVQGISLGAFESANNSVTYDNFKVYTDNSYVDYSDFDKQESTVTNPTANGYCKSDGQGNMPPSGWLKQNKYQTTGELNNRFTEVNGKDYDATSKPNDVAMKITGGDTWSHVLSRPIPANTAFKVSFDVKSATKWELSLMKKNQIYTTYESTLTGQVPFEAVSDETKGLNASTAVNKDAIQAGSAVFGVRTQPAQDKEGKLYLSGGAGERTWLADKDNENLKGWTLPEINTANWNHVSLTVEPQSSGLFKFTASLNENETFTWTSIPQCPIKSADEIHAIGFKNGGTDTTIDNFKVELIGKTPANIYVTDANAVSIANGAKTALSSGLAASGQKIEVNFSAPVASADAIKVYKYDGTATTAVTAEKSLSEDKKTATLTLSGITAGDKLTLEVPNTVAPATNDGLSRVEATAVAFDVKAAAEPEIKVEEFRLYKYYAGGKYASGKPSEACWAPATERDVLNATDTDKFKFTAKGYNTGKNEHLKFIGAFKDTNLRLRSAIMSDITLENQVGPFAKDTDEFTITERDGFIGAYLWELSTLKPLYKKFSATLPTTPVTPEN